MSLWTTVDCACGKPAPRAGDSIPEFKDKSLNYAEIVDALIDAFDLLTARVDNLEHQLLQLIGIVDLPLSPTEAIERLRQLREELES